MKKKSLVMVVAALLATGCQNTTSQAQTSVVSSSSEVTSVSESSSVVSSESSISSISSEESSSIPSSTSSSIEYFKWEADVVDVLVKFLVPKGTDEVPSFDYATYIEYDYEYILQDECFGIFCSTTDPNSETIYKQKLIASNWTIRDQKAGTFYEAVSPNEELLIQFEFNPDVNELDMYVMEFPLTEWPATLIAKYVNQLIPNTKTVIPSFYSQLYKVNEYIDSHKAIAINGFGYDDTVVDTYKTTLASANWKVTENTETDSWDAVSKYEDIQLNFYIDEERDNFSVDIRLYKKPSNFWPTDQVAALVTSLGATGTILPYTGECKGITVDTDYYPAAIVIKLNGDGAAAAAEYNQMLVDNGYVVFGTLFGEDIYYHPGDTVCYRGTNLTTGTMTIEVSTTSDKYITKA